MLPSSNTSRKRSSRFGAIFYLGFWGLIGLYDPFLNVYLAGLGLSGRQIGVLAALLPLMFLLVVPAVSIPADRFARRRRVLQGGLMGLALALLFFWLPRTFRSILPFAAVLALFRAPIAPIGDGVMTRLAVHHNLNYGRIRLWGSLGFAAATITGGALWQRVGFVPMFISAGLLALPLILIAGKLEEETPVYQIARPDWSGLLGRGMAAVLAASFLIGGYMGMTFNFEGVYLNSIGGGEWVVGLYFGIGALCELPAMEYSDKIARRLGRPATLCVAYGVLALANVVKAITTIPELFLLIGVVKGLGFGLYLVTTVRLVDELSPPLWSATAQGVLNAVLLGFAPLIANPVGGWIFDRFGGLHLFLISAMFAVIAAGIIGVAHFYGVFKVGTGQGKSNHLS